MGDPTAAPIVTKFGGQTKLLTNSRVIAQYFRRSVRISFQSKKNKIDPGGKLQSWLYIATYVYIAAYIASCYSQTHCLLNHMEGKCMILE